MLIKRLAIQTILQKRTFYKENGKFKSFKSDKEVCVNCNLTFKSKTEKFQHKKTIHNKDYLCSLCDFKTKSSQVIKEHERTHTGEKPLVCTWCGKAFSHRRTLQNHERLHTGEKPFQCKLCDSKFAQLTSLKSHTKSHHKDAEGKLETEIALVKRWNHGRPEVIG